MHRRHGIAFIVALAILLFSLSVLQPLAPKSLVNNTTLVLFHAFFMYVVIVVCDEVTLRLEGKSLISEICRSRRNMLLFLVVGVLGGLMLDGVAQWLGKLWIYPYWSNPFYACVFVVGFTAYWLVIAESYLAAKAILKRLLGRRQEPMRYYSFEGPLYTTLGALGALLIFLGVGLVLQEYLARGGYWFNITTPSVFKADFWYIMMIFFGVWFLLEYFEYLEKRSSLLKDTLHHYGIPAIAIIAASVALGIIMEQVNTVHHLWIYTNWPWPGVTFLGLPVAMLLAWPLQYVAFLSLFRAITDEESKEVWR